MKENRRQDKFLSNGIVQDVPGLTPILALFHLKLLNYKINNQMVPFVIILQTYEVKYLNPDGLALLRKVFVELDVIIGLLHNSKTLFL